MRRPSPCWAVEPEMMMMRKNRLAQKIIWNKKKVYMKNVIESVEEYQKHNNTSKIHQTINQFKKGYQHKFSMIRNKKGELAMNTKEKNMDRMFR
jgi:hypothetical protein